MLLDDVMDEVGEALDTIEGLRVFPYWADRITPPAAIVGFPDSYEFDQTYGRGSDRFVLPVLVLVGQADARTARDSLAKYVHGSGSASVKSAIESHTPTSYDSARVQGVEFGTVTVAGTPYLAATFLINIIGPGEVL